MSYSKIIENGRELYLCWNCGKIHIYEEETQHEGLDMDFITKLLNKPQTKELPI